MHSFVFVTRIQKKFKFKKGWFEASLLPTSMPYMANNEHIFEITVPRWTKVYDYSTLEENFMQEKIEGTLLFSGAIKKTNGVCLERFFDFHKADDEYEVGYALFKNKKQGHSVVLAVQSLGSRIWTSYFVDTYCTTRMALHFLNSDVIDTYQLIKHLFPNVSFKNETQALAHAFNFLVESELQQANIQSSHVQSSADGARWVDLKYDLLGTKIKLKVDLINQSKKALQVKIDAANISVISLQSSSTSTQDKLLDVLRDGNIDTTILKKYIIKAIL